MVFTVYECGFVPRSALEVSAQAQRLNRITEIIRDSRYGIHDLSRAGLDPHTGLARFNMPFELGLFLGAEAYGSGRQKKKQYLVLDRTDHRHLKFISDLRSVDPAIHHGRIADTIRCVRNWLSNRPDIDYTVPSARHVAQRFHTFRKSLPGIAHDHKLDPQDLNFRDYAFIVQEWIKVTER